MTLIKFWIYQSNPCTQLKQKWNNTDINFMKNNIPYPTAAHSPKELLLSLSAVSSGSHLYFGKYVNITYFIISPF